MADAIDWAGILREALQSAPSQPVLGTHYRRAVEVAANKHGVPFPPQPTHSFRFLEFLQRHADVVSVMRRAQQDFLVADATRKEPFASAPGGSNVPFGIRRDVFEALSTITDKRAFYNRETDSVEWHAGNDATSTNGQVALPVPTEADELDLRRAFSELQLDAEKASLLASLGAPLALREFAACVRRLNLQNAWRHFRTEKLIDRLQVWARDNEVVWKDAWITARSTHATPISLGTSSALAPQNEMAIRRLLSSLGPSDLQRISIPLDLVLKALAKE